jgi:hypothetical protein
LEKGELNTETECSIRKPLFTIPLTVKIDAEIYTLLGLIADFEHKKRGTLARDILVEKIKVYERNPAFKRFGPYRGYLKKHESVSE